MSNRSGRDRSTCSSGKSVLVACTLVQSIQHSRAEVRATLFRPIEKVPKETYVHSGNTFMRESRVSQHLSGAHTLIPLFCTSFPPTATASQGTIRVGSSENSMLRPFRRVGRVALRRSLPQQTWRFPRIDNRSIEASSAPTRSGAASERGCRLKAATPLVLLAYSVQWPRGEFKETLGDRSRRRLALAASLPVIGS